MKLGMTMYSFNRYAREGRIDVAGFLHFAAGMGLETVDLLAYYWRDERVEPDEALALIADLGLELAAYAVGNNFAQDDGGRFREQVDGVRRGIEMAHRLGAPAMRVFGGHAPGMAQADAMALARDGLEQVADEAAAAGVVLAVENHGGVPGTADEVLALLRAIDSPWVRSCVDVGNFLTSGDDPVEAVGRVIGYAAHAHIKDFRREADGGYEPCVPGRGVVDHAAVLKTFAAAGYQGSLAIEAEGPEDDLQAAREAVEWLRGLMEQLGLA